MRIVHFTSELIGGAGILVKNLHLSMLRNKIDSLLITRDQSSLEGVRSIRPFRKFEKSLLFRKFSIYNYFNILKKSYAMFGMQNCPITSDEIRRSLVGKKPDLFIFYWISFFIDFKTIVSLRENHPEVPFYFIVLDEFYLTGGICHNTNGCSDYSAFSKNCSATEFTRIKNKINLLYKKNYLLMKKIDPIIIYCTDKSMRRGQKTSLLKSFESHLVHLGVVTESEINENNPQTIVKMGKRDEKHTLLIRSSHEERKGCDLFIQAIKMLDKEVSNLKDKLKVISIGDNKLSQSIIKNFVDFEDLGFINRKKLIFLYKNIIDGLIVSSLHDIGPQMINECVAFGKFVISTNVGVAEDLIIHKKNGLIIDKLDSKSMAKEISRFLSFNKKFLHSKNNSNLIRTNKNITYEGFSNALINICNNRKNYNE